MSICRSVPLGLALLLLIGHCYAEHELASDWQQHVRELVAGRQLDAALLSVDQQLKQSPADLEAHGWRGRILAWKGRWPEAESEYRTVLKRVPSDVDILAALADVLAWQGTQTFCCVGAKYCCS